MDPNVTHESGHYCVLCFRSKILQNYLALGFYNLPIKVIFMFKFYQQYIFIYKIVPRLMCIRKNKKGVNSKEEG